MTVGKGISHGFKYGSLSGPPALLAMAVVMSAGSTIPDRDLSEGAGLFGLVIFVGGIPSIAIGFVIGGILGGLLALFNLEAKANWIAAIFAGAMPIVYSGVDNRNTPPRAWILFAIASLLFAVVGFIAGARFQHSINQPEPPDSLEFDIANGLYP